MFKKGTILIVLLVLALISSCGNRKNDTHNRDGGKSANGDQLHAEYQLAESKYEKNGIQIRYPQLIEAKGNIKQEDINRIIREEAIKILNYYDSEDELSLDARYQIMFKDEGLLSIQYIGIGDIKGAAHPNNLFYSTNINLQEAKKIRLSDVVEVNNQLIDKLKAGEFSLADSAVLDKNEVVQWINAYTNDDLMNKFVNSDSLDYVGTVQQTDTFSYFTKEFLGISINVPHVYGDHVELKIKYKDMGNISKTGSD